MHRSLIPVEAFSSFYRHWLNANVDDRLPLLDSLVKHNLTAIDYDAWLNKLTPTVSVAQALRRIRNALICSIIHRDLNGLASLDEVFITITNFAEFSIRQLYDFHYKQLSHRHGIPIGTASQKQQDMIVLAMGKLGGKELNVSSDIDLIFVYPESGQTQASETQRPIDNQTFFTRLAQRFIRDMSDIVEDGFVFRVDMALRPNGESGPLVANFNMLEQYFIVQGREWERYAWIKARAITGNKTDIDTLFELVRPFVYRRYLDYNIIEAIRHLHEQIRADVVRQERLHPERSNNIKLGRGGIREIEFMAQMFQLIRGGKDPSLQERSTRSILHLLKEKRLLDDSLVEQLLNAYHFLRNLEHRLQYINDQQTHSLPIKADDLERLAKSAGFENTQGLITELQKHRDFVSNQFDTLFNDKSENAPSVKAVIPQPLLSSQTTQEQLQFLQSKCASLGCSDANLAAQRLLAFWQSSRIASLPDNSRTKVIDLINTLLPQVVSSSHNDIVCLGRLLDFLESISRRNAYLALLTEFPKAAQRLLTMLDASDWASTYLNRHPILLDELLDNRTLMAPPDWDFFTSQLHNQLSLFRGDTERLMDILREAHHAQLFRFLAQDLAGGLTVEKLADHLSLLADIIVEATLQEAWLAMPKRHRDKPQFAVIAYGKLGGKELGYASDLDLIFLYDDDHSDAARLYARLAQRFITWMTTPTSAGILFDIDIALRPDGDSGLMVSSFASFEKYQSKTAWAWEHQALTRARFCAGDKRIGERFEALRDCILRKKRDNAWLKNEIIHMRNKIHESHPNHSQLFDIKHDSGGMIDIEFMVQYLVLEFSEKYKELTNNFGNIALLKMAENLNLLPKGQGEHIATIYRHFRKLQHQIRMQGAMQAKLPANLVESEKNAVRKLWQYLFDTK